MSWLTDNFIVQRLGPQLVTTVLLFAVAGLLAALSLRFDYTADWTANKRNSLTQASQLQLASMKAPLQFTAFVSQDESIRREIKTYLARYLRNKADASLRFVDPVANPQQARELGISANGELVIEYQGRRENLLVYQLSEQTITGALQRLSFGGETTVRFLDGHGERNLNDPELAGYARFTKELRDKGLKVEPLNLARMPQIPTDTSVLVIAGPQSQLLPGEVQILRAFVASGGNLLWLSDPGKKTGLTPLAEDIGIDLLKGTVVYPDYEYLQTGHPAMALITEYPPNGITQGLFDITLFPFAGALQTRTAPGQPNAGGWRIQPILATHDRTWLDTGNIEEDIEFRSEDGDIRGPLLLGASLERAVPAAAMPDDTPAEILQAEDKTQRIVIVADSDFMANGYLYNIGNLQLATNMIQWLAHRDTQLSIVVPPAPDTHLYLPIWASIMIGLGFVFLLPLGLIGFGVGRWWVRQRR